MGDSVAQGSAGDWTWRYRLWRHLEQAGVAADLVGPRNDLFDNMRLEFGSHDYLDPAFDTDHAARWGMSFTDQDHPIGDLIEAFDPDVVVEALGINDLVWQAAGADGVHDRLRLSVEQARSADPDIDLVLARLPQTWLADVPEANARISELPGELADDRSRIEIATTDSGFYDRIDTYDAGHPNAAGELKIAAAVADALSRLGVGTPYVRPLPEVPLGPRWAPVLAGESGDRAAHLTWSGSPGSDHEYLWQRDVTAGQSWSAPGPALAGTETVVTGLRNGHTYRFKLQPVKGYHAAADDVRSNVVTLTPQAPPPGGVDGLSVRSRWHALGLQWAATPGATRYLVDWWVLGREAAAQRLGTTASRALITGVDDA
ncbi:MAG TPA: GDSL-type esterase/lipase family protein [Nocardioides sp.]|uniref:GDSL-type esterase/lipase family protein n=1 Tax=Nocardioides sp. TaxID=35761 RepID=UPI002D0023AB|nr:hypothetical protein [Nocardioides sp.]HQR27254.1 GDSL-type esterase/lipase family protein [Nocardioides sp.]